jgi:ATP-dependent Lhr-like helicase
VPFEVAMEVGRMRRLIDINKSLPVYPCTPKTLDEIKKQIQLQKEKQCVVPTDKVFTLEVENRHLVINICCGTKGNETIGRILSALLAQSIGESIGITNDPYRIHLELPYRMSADKIKDLFYTTSPDSLEYLLSSMLKNSTFIRWQLVHSARKFGALRKDFDYQNIGIKKLFTLFDHTPIFDEAIEKVLWERMDLDHAKEIFQQIQEGTINFVIQKLSPIGLSGMDVIKGLMAPQRADRTILTALKHRIEDTRMSLACVNCKKIWHVHVKNAPSHPICPRCHAIKIAVLPSHREKELNVLKKKNMNAEQSRELKRLYKNASLVLYYGRSALITLMGRGVGPDTAARILRKFDPVDLHRNEEVLLELIREIHKAEIHYAQTRGFWDT